MRLMASSTVFACRVVSSTKRLYVVFLTDAWKVWCFRSWLVHGWRRLKAQPKEQVAETFDQLLGCENRYDASAIEIGCNS